MSGLQDGIDERKSRNSRRGSTNNNNRLEAFTNRDGRGGADWGSCDSERLQSVVVGITVLGGAVTFGLSRDNGAHSLTLMLDGNKETMWYNGDADLNEGLDKVLVAIQQIT